MLKENRMLRNPRIASSLGLVVGVAAAAIVLTMPQSVAQPADARFSNPARFMAPTGEGLYVDVCQGCHMPGGVGAVGAGAYPALARNPNLASAVYPLTLVINGRNGMPPFGDLLTDQQVAAVVNYVRTHFGNQFADDVTAADAKAARP
jgi:mono/diheme cytochrome c family protein